MQTRVGSVLVASVSVSSYEPSTVYSEGPFFWCSPSFLTLTLFLPTLLCGSLISDGRNSMETSHTELRVPRTLHVVSDCGSLHLFLSAAGGNYSDDD